MKTEGTSTASGRVAILIPAYNEARSIGSVVALCKKYGRVVVIDDGSEDGTAEIAHLSGAEVVRRGKNGGYGAAIKSALGAAKNMDSDVFVFIDADMQHDPREIPRLVAPIFEGKADVVVGSRFLGKAVGAPAHRIMGVKALNSLTGAQVGSDALDYQCGFRAFSKRAIGKLSVSEDGYSACSELVACAVGQKFRIVEVPVTIHYFEDVKRAGAVEQGMGIASSAISAIVKRKPLVFFSGAGMILMLASAAIGFFVVETFYTTHVLAIGSAFLTVFFGIAGLILLQIGINLYTLDAVIRNRK